MIQPFSGLEETKENLHNSDTIQLYPICILTVLNVLHSFNEYSSTTFWFQWMRQQWMS